MKYFLLFIFGLTVGSFLNVCIYRLPREKSVVFPPSSCPECGHKLSGLDLVPVLSFLFLLGKCRYCRNKIHWRYPLVELLTAAGFVLSGLMYTDHVAMGAAIVFISSLLVIFFADLDLFIVPDEAVIAGSIAGITMAFVQKTIFSALLGGVIGGGFLLLIAVIGRAIYKKDVMGYGDVKLAAMLGVFLGASNLIVALYLAFIIGSIIGVFLIVTGIKKKEDYIPFAPSLVLGALPVFFYGEIIRKWWFGLLGFH
ncbi:MAG: prepilin peptidase [Candidatus Margulisiibacteriota bacterium]